MVELSVEPGGRVVTSMSVTAVSTHAVLVRDPSGRPDPALARAAARAGARGLVDVATEADVATAVAAAPSSGAGEIALRCRPEQATILAGAPVGTTVVLDARHDAADGSLAAAVTLLGDRQVLVEVTSVDGARRALAAGAAGLVAVGSEAGGRVGGTESSILLQAVVALADPEGLPVWAAGGIGLHTAAAAIAGGAPGVVLDSQLALVRECTLDDSVKAAVASMDGSETRVVGGHRVYTRPDLPAAALAERRDRRRGGRPARPDPARPGGHGLRRRPGGGAGPPVRDRRRRGAGRAGRASPPTSRRPGPTTPSGPAGAWARRTAPGSPSPRAR